MTLVLGVDGGATKTHAVVADTTGRVLGAGHGGSSNWEDIGLFPAGRVLHDAVAAALSRAGTTAKDLDATVFGLAGVDWPTDVTSLTGVLLPIGLAGTREIVNDSFVALRAGASSPSGVVVIAGSGTVVAGRNPAGDVFRTLGLGTMFGDFGGAQDVGEEAVRSVARAYTGVGPETALTHALCDQLGFGSVEELLERLSRTKPLTDPIEVATFAPAMLAAADAGDPVATDIVTRAAAHLVDTVAAVRHGDPTAPIVLAGSVVTGDTAVAVQVKKDLSARWPAAPLCPARDGAAAAAWLAALDLGIHLPHPAAA